MANTNPNFPREVPPAVDSSPTPVIEMGYRNLHARLLILASRFDSNALILRKNLALLDIAGSKRSMELADEVRRLAELVEEWPDKPSFAIAGQKNHVAARYMNIMTEARKLIGQRVL